MGYVVSGGRLVVVVDAGTTRVRCLVFDSSGTVVAERSAGWDYLDVEDVSPYARELDPAAVWRSTAELVAACVGAPGVEARRIAAVTVTSQRQGVVFLDREGGRCTRARTWTSGPSSRERPSTTRWGAVSSR